MARVRIGDRVTVPWGLEELPGVVVEIYGPPGRPSAMVRLPVYGSSGEILEETTLSFPLDALRPETPSA
jgi:hypothetical protein